MQSTRENAKWYLLGILFLANSFIWYAIFAEQRNGILTVAFLDVGQGDAIFIEAPNGNQMLIDGGPNRAVLKALSGVMPFYDRTIDVVVATHPDQDHIGGLPAVFENYDADYFLEPGVAADTGVYERVVSLMKLPGMTHLIARRGQTVFLDDEVALTVLFPDRDASGLNPNDASIVAKLVYGDTSFLLTGDAPKKIEEYLAVVDGKNLRADVLKAGHHGSKTSTSDTFLGFASPLFAVISSGKENRYGHPHKEALSLLELFDVKTLRTDQFGTITFTSDGENVYYNY